MTKAGDFFFYHDQELAEKLLLPICEAPRMRDLARLCSEWFRKSPKKIPMSVATLDQNGKLRPVTLKLARFRTNWQ